MSLGQIQLWVLGLLESVYGLLPGAAAIGGLIARLLDRGGMVYNTDAYSTTIDKTGASDSSAGLYALAVIANGRPIYCPEGIYTFNSQIFWNPTPGSDGHAPGIRIFGDGKKKTIFRSNVANDYLFKVDLNVAANTAGFVKDVEFRDLTLNGSTLAPAGGSAISLRHCRIPVTDGLDITGFANNGIKIVCTEGDTDGTVLPILRQTHIDLCGGWGIDATGATSHNEISWLRLEDTTIQRCGTVDASVATTEPVSGGMRWKGQGLTVSGGGFINNNEVGLFVPGDAGLATNLTIDDTVAFEQNKKRDLHISGLNGGLVENCQFYHNATYTATYGVYLDSTTYLISSLAFRNNRVRIDPANNPFTMFALAGSNAQWLSVNDTSWDQFDGTGQTRFSATFMASKPSIRDGGFWFPQNNNYLAVNVAGDYTPDATRYSRLRLQFTATGAHAINAATGTGASQDGTSLTLEIANASGGTIAVTFDASYHAWQFTNPTNGAYAVATFDYNATDGWHQRTAWTSSTTFLTIPVASVTGLGTGVAALLAGDATGSGAPVGGTSPTIATPTITTSVTVPLVVGGTTTTSTLSLKSTSGVGTTGANIIFLVGNNGATTAATILNSGNIGVGQVNPLNLFCVGTVAQGALEIAPGTSLTIQSFNRNGGAYAGMSIDALNQAYRIRATSGSAINFKYVGSATLLAALVMEDTDVSTNLTATNFAVTAKRITMPASTNTDAGTRAYYANQVVPGAIVQTTAAGTNTWTGFSVTLPAITQTTGTVTTNGFQVLGGVVTSGTPYAFTSDSLAGNSGFGTIAPAAQVEIDPAAAGTTGLIVKGAASRSAALIKLQTSAGGSLGTVSGGCVGDVIANVSTTHTDGTFDTLRTDTLVANALIANGDKFHFDYTITVATHTTNSADLKLAFAGITIWDSGALTFAAAGRIRVFGYISRVTSTTGLATISFEAAGSTTIVGYSDVINVPTATLTGLTLTGTNNLVLSAAAAGTGAASGDITLVQGTFHVDGFGS